jgi:hypothetical protein
LQSQIIVIVTHTMLKSSKTTNGDNFE